MQTSDRGTHQSLWTVRKFRDAAHYRHWLAGVDAPADVVEIDGNLFLNEGIGEILDLACGLGGTAFSNAAAMLGVGDSTAAAAATQTGLQAVTNKLYKAMETGYPQRSGQTVTFRAVFADAEANWAWEEFSVSNATDDTGVNWNRKVQSAGTKANGTWTLDLQITIS